MLHTVQPTNCSLNTSILQVLVLDLDTSLFALILSFILASSNAATRFFSYKKPSTRSTFIFIKTSKIEVQTGCSYFPQNFEVELFLIFFSYIIGM